MTKKRKDQTSTTKQEVVLSSAVEEKTNVECETSWESPMRSFILAIGKRRRKTTVKTMPADNVAMLNKVATLGHV